MATPYASLLVWVVQTCFSACLRHPCMTQGTCINLRVYIRIVPFKIKKFERSMLVFEISATSIIY